MIQNTTIAAISSGQTPAAIGVIRLSGPNALAITAKCLKNSHLVPRKMHARAFHSPLDENDKIDDVLVCYFKAPHSFTGEDSIEIYAHGGIVNLSRVLDAVCTAGAIPAEPGEFSKRAFLNQKLDLAQAEAIMDIIHAQNEQQCREAQKQLSGSISGSVAALRASIMQLLCAIEATIDFSTEEELAPLPVEKLRSEGAMILDRMMRMKRAHDQYRAGGIKTVFVGLPNAGKSSLFNCLLGHDRAIVTQIAGTTTDTIEAQLSIHNTLFSLIDTAGITESDNPIEAIGVERTKEQIENADILVLLIDGLSSDDAILCELNTRCRDALSHAIQNHTILAVRTKADIDSRPIMSQNIASFLKNNDIPLIDISVMSRKGMMPLEDKLAEMARAFNETHENVTLITSQRHIVQLNQAEVAIKRSLEALDNMLPAECIAADLHEAAQSLALITGEVASEDIINEIFSHFCIGK